MERLRHWLDRELWPLHLLPVKADKSDCCVSGILLRLVQWRKPCDEGICDKRGQSATFLSFFFVFVYFFLHFFLFFFSSFSFSSLLFVLLLFCLCVLSSFLCCCFVLCWSCCMTTNECYVLLRAIRRLCDAHSGATKVDSTCYRMDLSRQALPRRQLHTNTQVCHSLIFCCCCCRSSLWGSRPRFAYYYNSSLF